MERTTPPGSYFESVLARFERRAADGLRFTAGAPADAGALARAASRLGVEFPPEFLALYTQTDGFVVESPALEVLPLSALAFATTDRLHFATVDSRHRLCFDTSGLNMAGQWTLVTADSGYAFTYTLGSFWSNKVWKWLDSGAEFWAPRQTADET